MAQYSIKDLEKLGKYRIQNLQYILNYEGYYGDTFEHIEV